MLRWQGSDLEVRSEVIPRYFWMTASIDVFFDGSCILRTGGVLRLRGTQRVEFTHGDENHVLELAWRSPILGVHFPYRLFIDGHAIMDWSRVRPRNWPLLLIPAAAILALPVLQLIWMGL